MTDDEALLRAIAESSDEDVPRLAYADWLDEHDVVDRAEFIRVQCALARLAGDDTRRNQLHERQALLLDAHRREWLPTNWSFSSYPPETWRRGFVTGIEKQGGRITHADGASLAAVPTVECLSFVATRVTDEEFRHLPLLPNLREFALWGSEELTDATFARLSQWSALHSLQLVSTGLTDDGFGHLATLRELRSLAVEDGIEAEVLTDAGLIHLAGLTNLEELSLGAAGIRGAGLQVLLSLSRLRKLALTGCGLSEDVIVPLVECQWIEELNLNHYQNEGIGDRLLAALPRLPRLRSLHAIRNDVTAFGFRVLGHLTGLETLAVGGPAFGDHELTYLLGLDRLRRLQLHANQFTAEGLASLVALPGLRALNLSYRQQHDGILGGIAHLKQLQWLDIESNATDEGLGLLAEMPNLEVLRFRGPFVSNAGIARLKLLPKLRCLSAEMTTATKEFVWDRRAEWAPHLESLSLNGHTYGLTEPLSAGW